MNLVAEIIERFSGNNLGTLQRAAAALPVYLFDRSLALSPLLLAQRRRVARIRECLERGATSAQLARDSEIYFPIFTLAETAADQARTEDLLRRLEFLLGLEDCTALTPGYYRLTRPVPRVVRVASNGIEEIADAQPLPMFDGRSIVHMPRDGLFHDLLPKDLYPSTQESQSQACLVEALDVGSGLLAAQCPDLMQDLVEAISTIVLIPDWLRAADGSEDHEGNERWCFNLRLRYFGGIFLNLYRVGGCGALEGMVHEYCHQRLWLWWEIDRPSGVPDRHDTMVSPVTGLQRSVAVMVHALVIYFVIADVYQTLLNSRHQITELPWLIQRRAKIVTGIPTLVDELSRRLKKGTVLSGIVQWLGERWRKEGFNRCS
ncbi:hypothetical protein [Bradyrhizobium sp. SZCCHNS3051]|uniref:hypothetical protein n=1 Tax=Bradyrhizobium sp. SZCCHNS3051 TaxID=3057320 RepID=UPI002916025C|nr:hypothetical protein [Bradyrhizobium sp. SZCCHNS3051]